MTGIPKPRDFGLKGAKMLDYDRHIVLADRAERHVVDWLAEAGRDEVHPASALVCLLIKTRHVMKDLGGPTADELIRTILDGRGDIPPDLQRRFHEAVAAGVQRLGEGGGRPS